MPTFGSLQVAFAGYGGGAFGFKAYDGYIPAVIVPSEREVGIPFLVGNDRYQVIVCSSAGTTTTAPEFRYWYAGGAPWGEVIRGDTDNPRFYTVDEDGTAPSGSVEFPFREIKVSQEAQIDGVLVEYTPQPYNLIVGDDTTATVGFSCHVESYGPPDYTRTTGAASTGILSSDTVTLAETLADETDEPWPNTRTAYIPIRVNRVRGARIIFTDITLCEINRATLLGKTKALSNA